MTSMELPIHSLQREELISLLIEIQINIMKLIFIIGMIFHQFLPLGPE